MRYIIIGGSGFVGGYTIAALLESMKQGRVDSGKIICLDRVESEFVREQARINSVHFVHCDLLQGFDFALESSDIIIHLAARAYAPKPPLKPFGTKALEQYFCEVNVAGTQAVLEQMKRCNASKIIYFSTDMVYGKPQYLPIDPAHPRAPFGYYGLSKVLSEDLLIRERESGLKACIFRPRIIVGAGRFGILTKLFWLISHNLPVPLIGDGSNCYQMISVQDCAQAIICALTREIPNGQFNLGSHNPPTIRTLLRSLITQAGSKSPLLPTHAPSVKLALSLLETLGIPLMYKEQYAIANEQYIVDIAHTQQTLGWDPLHSDSDMLFSAFREYQQQKR